MSTLSIATSYTVIDCYKCGSLFAVPSQVNDEFVRSGRSFYCPNGHSQFYTESTETQLRKEREARARAEQRAQATRDLLAAEERSHAATRGVVTKQRKKLARVVKGVCPCCNRSFEDLARHMQTKHPGYDPTPVAASG